MSGVLGKQQLDTKRMDEIKEAVFRFIHVKPENEQKRSGVLAAKQSTNLAEG